MSSEDLGNSLAGSAGSPQLTLTGTLCPDDPTNLDVVNLVADSTSFLVIGASDINAPLKGGVLVPSPDIIIARMTSPAGSSNAAFPWPCDFPAGTRFSM